jgi:hypothetical protein
MCAAVSLLAACASGGSSPVAEPSTPVQVAPDVAPAAPVADGLPAELRDGFASADLRARGVAYWMQCVATVARLRSTGTFGAAASAPRAWFCERNAYGVPLGGVYDIDSSFRTVRRLTVVRLDGARPRYLEPLDTARIARTAKLVREVTRAVTPAWNKLGRPFSTVPLIVENGAVEAWVIPRANKARSFVSGGDVGYRLGASGAPELVADRANTWTQLTLPATGTLRIYSSVRDVAAVTDLATARYQHELGREVVVSTPAMVSTLVAGLDEATGARTVWKHTPVKRP